MSVRGVSQPGDDEAVKLVDTSPAEWPAEPEPVDAGEGSRADRLRMLQSMRGFWNACNRSRSERIVAEVQLARTRQAEATVFWDLHKDAVKAQWINRTGARGQTRVADIPEVAAQWHPSNPLGPDAVLATAQQPGTVSPYLWQCPRGLNHSPWAAWPKDRIQHGAGCPACRHLTKLSDIPTLAGQYRGSTPAHEITHASHAKVDWICRTWALDPSTGRWRRVEHRFKAVLKQRALQRDGCLICAGYTVDDSNSLLAWFPELADQLDNPKSQPQKLPTSQHNISRKDLTEEDRSGVYATCRWRCRHGHRWKATILNRVRGGDCPQCSLSGISKEQVKLVAELAGLLNLVPPAKPDPRLPKGVPDFASHQVTVPQQMKPQHWRYKHVEIDAIFELQGYAVRIGVEYDGAYHHSAKRRDRHRYEIEKSQVLAKAGILDLLIHVRLGDLPPLEAPNALMVPLPERATPHEQARAVAAAVDSRFPGAVPKLGDYLADGLARQQAKADAYIAATWGEARPPRQRPKKPASRTRKLSATEPHPQSLLIPDCEPYRDPEHPTRIIRDYRCKCGNQKLFTAVQSQVTSGNTRSCGCLLNQTRRQKRAPITRAETQATREWALGQGFDLGSNGRVPDQMTATYRLHQVGRLDLTGPDGLLDPAEVQKWAKRHGHPLGARGRVPGHVWLKYASACLAQPVAMDSQAAHSST
ncbi:zinc-ribbon domain-containing protein [Kribbella sp.]|uniref:zinc-ribbon domain-containing protein n=1 Tax=Kribbella sp. TaxID=1871183 RepID=UPI002D7326D6|nr:zinc-ribbon domain-containing protein [Kribbella sp.]HZX08212.1 zinc-ribbon domain-containing protein [Kribbella sp.]